MVRCLLCSILSVLPFLSFGQSFRISGKGEGIANAALNFVTISDPVLKLENTVLTTNTDSSGAFSASIPLQQTRLLWCRIGPWKTYFFAEPGMDYNVQLPDLSKVSTDYLSNPYFEAAGLHLPVLKAAKLNNTQLKGKELNQAIREFDSQLEAFLDVQLVRYYTPEQANASLDSFLAVAFTPVQVSDQEYFDRYRQQARYYLEFLSGRVSARDIVNELFTSARIDYGIPLLAEFFQLVFGTYFSDISGEESFRSIFHLLNQGSLHQTQELLLKNTCLTDTGLMELVLLDQMYVYYYKGGLSRQALITLTDSLGISSARESNRSLARQLKGVFTRLSPGTPAPSFKLQDKNGMHYENGSFHGKFLILNFCNPDNLTCLQEFEYLKVILPNFGPNLQVVTVYEAVNSSFPEHLGNAGNWLFIQSTPEILSDFNVRAYPYFILIDDAGNIVHAPAPIPTEGLDRELYRIMRLKGKI
jgi:hypothetical protein